MSGSKAVVGKASHVIGQRAGEQFDDSRTSTSQLQGRPASSSSIPPPSLSTPTFHPVTMASRRLAFNLNQALRSRAALKSIQPVKRGFASPVALPSTTQSTTLSNGFTVRIDCIGV